MYYHINDIIFLVRFPQFVGSRPRSWCMDDGILAGPARSRAYTGIRAHAYKAARYPKHPFPSHPRPRRTLPPWLSRIFYRSSKLTQRCLPDTFFFNCILWLQLFFNSFQLFLCILTGQVHIRTLCRFIIFIIKFALFTEQFNLCHCRIFFL